MKHLYRILVCLPLLWLYTACTSTEKQVETSDEEITINWDTRSTDDDNDYQIDNLRVLIFNADDGQCMYNYNYNADPGSRITFQIKTLQTYHVAVIANETSDNSSLTTLLETYTANNAAATWNSLDNIVFSAAAFNRTKAIPMATRIEDLYISNNRRYKIGNGELKGGYIPFDLERLAVRLDLELFTQVTAKLDKIEKLVITNLPKEVPLFATKNADGSLLYNVVDAPGVYTSDFELQQVEESGKLKLGPSEWESDGDLVTPTYTWKLIWPTNPSSEGIILPSSVFQTPTETKLGIALDVVYESGSEYTTEGIWLGINIPETKDSYYYEGNPGDYPLNYTLPRNTQMKLKIEIEESNILISPITVTDWGTKNNVEIID